MVSSVSRPCLAAGAICVRSAGFAAYVYGYNTGDPTKRLYGGPGTLKKCFII